MDSPEYPQLSVLKGVVTQLEYLDINYGENVFLGDILDGYMKYFREYFAFNLNQNRIFRPEDNGWGPDLSNPDIITVAGYFSLQNVDEFRLSIFDAIGYLDYIEQVETEFDGKSRFVPEFVFGIKEGDLYMEFVLRNIDLRMRSEVLAYVDENGVVQANDPSISEILPLVQKLWDIGSSSFVRASFSNN